MTNLFNIRKRLGLTQKELGVAIGYTKGRVSQLETRPDSRLPPAAADRLIAHAAKLGCQLSYDDIYAPASESTEAAA